MKSLTIVRNAVEQQLNRANLEINKNEELYTKLRKKEKRDVLDEIELSNALREKSVNERLKIFAESLLKIIDTQIEIKEYEESEDYKIFELISEEIERDRPIDIQI
ncbi:TPA: hypothetical protein KR283_003237 [Clostridioides difficile]|uniref:Putative phage protein n=2 Tax=root TaxID=1 RepID=A0A0A8WJ75_9CAUD|nr:hypothetical protein [Clostridioides difficile]YP_009206178.1 hypothetical protein PHIMMP01_20059 [Clostridium phage phiMMP01]AXU30861.1 hypothetical protein CDIF102860_01272 [Clostridioides difficile]AXU34649.1 hypothetical protein CDIF102978_01272 [Clostridioides difficile]EGT3664903.1 hypothetical protein [Clostridioides difficile]EGT3762004.1 hypothetical protein [Clostridioides difficile]EGT3823811.1 hypothetical protein [Clostridioides difficile]